MIVILSPGFYSLPGLFDRFELVHVQAFISQPAVEGLEKLAGRVPQRLLAAIAPRSITGRM
jgi:hypothetical protein